ncbi:ROK family protein [Plantibacter sp. Mn2098]|uniref:ROK family protein n=1 Tax=Plantibacter sp. Mn2098 TaxID=3395266 RepID=UPI003BD0A41C
MALSGGGANSDDMRRHNLSTVLGILHHNRRLSRTEITHASGLARSSVKGLVAELERVGLCFESEPEANFKSGRPSPTVEPRDDVLSVGVSRDARGLTVGFATLGATIVHQRWVPLERATTSMATADAVAAIIDESRAALPADALLVGIGAAVPGFVSGSEHNEVFAASISWDGEPFAEHLSAATGLDAWVRFDAHLGVTAESIWGAGKDRPNVYYLYGGPGGIGSAAIVNGRLLSGNVGMASSLAHTIVKPGGRLCVCGSLGCFQAEVRLRDVFPQADARDASRHGVTPPPVPAEDLRREIALTCLGVRAAVLAFDPELILFDGFLSTLLEAGRADLEAATTVSAMPRLSQQVTLGVPALGSDRLLIGAADLGFRGLLADPVGLVARLRD